MSRFVALGVTLAGLSFVVLTACVGEDSGSIGPGVNGTSGNIDGGSGSEGGGPCKGDTVDACGASCTKCTVPGGGTVACVNGACEKSCSATLTLCGETCTDTTT